MNIRVRLRSYIFAVLIFTFIQSAGLWAALVEITNYKSGISLTIEGINGQDFAVERFYHDPALDDRSVVYIKENVKIKLEHNDNNVMNGAVVGKYGPDGIPDSGDEGIIAFKVDRDEQAHSYLNFAHPAVNEYVKPFSFDELFYEDGLPVVGTLGSNNLSYGRGAKYTSNRYQRGILDNFSDEWHILAYWDNENHLLPAGLDTRYALSDSKIVFFVVNPKTPLISFLASNGEQFYTTPPKAYNIPLVREQTTYLTGGTLIQFVNITNGNNVFYRINGGEARQYSAPITARTLGNGTHIIEYWFEESHKKTRTVVVNPDYPSRNERHGYLLWKDDAGLSYIQQKFKRSPYSEAYNTWKRNIERNFENLSFPLRTRLGWRGWCGVAPHALNYSIPFYIENIPASSNIEYAKLAKTVLLELFVVDPVGCESAERHIPSGDRIDIPNSAMNSYAAAPIAYDLLINNFKSTDYPGYGITPIEDYKIRDNLANQVHALMIMRSHVSGSDTPDKMVGYTAGDMHWGLGYELLIYLFGIAMPSYSSSYFGTSGFDGTRVVSEWAPFKNQKLTWWDVIARHDPPCAPYPDNVSIRRFELCYKTFEELLSYPRHESAIWDFPTKGTFWIAANAFNGGDGVYRFGEKNPSDLTNTEVMLVPDNINPADYGLQVINTITGRICQKAGIGRNRSFNMHTVADENDGLWHTEYSGYESPFVPNAILVNYLHKLHYGEPVSQSIQDYLDTKLDRMNGNFDKHYLRQAGSSSDILSAGSPIPLSNPDFLLAAVPLSIHNPVISPKGQVRLDQIKEWIDTQYYFRVRSFGGSILNLVLFEDDPAKYEAIPAENIFDTYGNENLAKTGFTVFNNIIKKSVNGAAGEAVIECIIKEPAKLTLKIFDSKGREILIVIDEHLNSGVHRFSWGGRDSSGKKVGSGIYMVHMKCGSYAGTKKIAVVK